MLPLYNVLIYLASPIALAANVWRGRRDPTYRDRLGERFGFTKARFERSPLWVHAVSVGEVQAGAVLIRSLRKRYPDRPILVTTATPTGAERVKVLFGDTVTHVYLPYDMPGQWLGSSIACVPRSRSSWRRRSGRTCSVRAVSAESRS
jgi:3-deoxy-D-manno-octulosonic-acid transferase